MGPDALDLQSAVRSLMAECPAVSPDFVLQPARANTLLIAAGSGIAASATIARALYQQGHRCELHCFVRTAEHLAFCRQVETHGKDLVTVWNRLPADQLTETLEWLLGGGVAADSALYAFGPVSLLDQVRTISASRGWDADHVHLHDDAPMA